MDDISRESSPAESGAAPVSERQKGPEELGRFEQGLVDDIVSADHGLVRIDRMSAVDPALHGEPAELTIAEQTAERAKEISEMRLDEAKAGAAAVRSWVQNYRDALEHSSRFPNCSLALGEQGLRSVAFSTLGGLCGQVHFVYDRARSLNPLVRRCDDIVGNGLGLRRTDGVLGADDRRGVIT